MKSAKSFGFCFLAGQRKNKTKRFRYVRGGKQTLVYPRTVHSSTVSKYYETQLMLRDFIFKIIIKKRFKAHKNSLPKESNIIDPKMEYDAIKGAVYWEDEGLMESGLDLANALGPVICFRTHLITYPVNEIENNDFNKFDKQIFTLAKQYFPDWIGFSQRRCSYNPELSDRIKRMRKVSEWQLNKLMTEENGEE